MRKLKNGLYFENQLKKYGVTGFTTTVLYGDMKNKKNRRDYLKKYFGIKKVIFGKQTHSDNIKIVTEKDINKIFYSTDGFITNRKNVPLAVFTADCLPVFIYDKVKKIIGLVHAGRVGLEKMIISKAIGTMVKVFHSDPGNIFIAVGPHIKKCCYDTDLDKVAKKQINTAGVNKISFTDVCTHNKDFFSYRKNKTEKRMISVMTMDR